MPATHSDTAPPDWRPPEGLVGLAAAAVGGSGAWPGFEPTPQTRTATQRRRCGGRRRVRRARAGFEIDHSEPPGSRVAISRAAEKDARANTPLNIGGTQFIMPSNPDPAVLAERVATLPETLTVTARAQLTRMKKVAG